MGLKELPLSEGEETRLMLVRDYDYDDGKAAGVVKATNEAVKTVLEELIQFENRVDTQLNELRSEIKLKFDETKRHNRYHMIGTGIGIASILATLWVPYFGPFSS